MVCKLGKTGPCQVTANTTPAAVAYSRTSVLLSSRVSCTVNGLAATGALADKRRATDCAGAGLTVPAIGEGFSPRAAWLPEAARAKALANISWVRVLRGMGNDSKGFWWVRAGKVVSKFRRAGVVDWLFIYCMNNQYHLEPLAMSVFQRTQVLTDIHADVWQAHAMATAPFCVQATGNGVLDTQLPGGGWPVGAMTEVLQGPGVHCEWRLLLPALARCGQGPVVLVGAPHLPFAPALAAQGLPAHRLLCVATPSIAQRLWAAEQALRCAAVDAVLLWLACAVRTDPLRRLQMAAAQYNKLLFVMRPALAQADASPALLRLQVGPDPLTTDGLEVKLLKRRGPPLNQPLKLQARAAQLAMLLALHAGPLVSRPSATLPRYRDALDRTAARAA